MTEATLGSLHSAPWGSIPLTFLWLGFGFFTQPNVSKLDHATAYILPCRDGQYSSTHGECVYQACVRFLSAVNVAVTGVGM